MANAFSTALIATLTYAALYTLLGWVNMRAVHHYYEVANNPSLNSPTKRLAAWLLKAALLYALLGWTAELATATNILVSGFPVLLRIIVFVAVWAVSCSLALVVVLLAFKMKSEFTSISPEFQGAFMLQGFELFAIHPRFNWPWTWLPGLQ
jgi:hypothetical protein